jgi:long-chain acyl-CoA synthetase
MIWNIGNLLPAAAARFGPKTALVTEGRSFSFLELDRLSSRFAGALRTLGVDVGDRVSLYSPNCWEWVVSYYGILKSGAVVNPINVMLTPEEVAYVTNDCGAKAIISSSDRGASLAARGAEMCVRNIILFGDVPCAGTLRFEDLIATAADVFSAVQVEPDSLSTIGYTSGTTGHPKGAMLSHRNVLTSTAMTATMHSRTDSDVVVTALPCSHVYGNVVMNAAFWFGMTLVLIKKFSEHEVLDAIQRYRATMFEGVPTMYMYLLAYPRRREYDTSSLRLCTVGGQTMPVSTMQAFETEFGCPLIELWGMTEVAGPATTHAFYADNRHGSVGVALPGVQCRIASVEDPSKTLPPDEVGELLVRGPVVMQGYYRNESETTTALGADGWLRSGDLARMDRDGYIYVVDRKKDMIITGGFNVYPAELERVLASHPAVSLVAVGPQPDELKGEVAKAYIVRKPNVRVTESEIVAFCREHLAAYKVPRAVQFVEELPKTSTGKIMRRSLRSLDEQRR